MPVTAAPMELTVSLSYVDLRDTTNRLGRVHITGGLASFWLTQLDPKQVRMISDSDLALLVGGTLTPPDGWPDGTFGAGVFGVGVFDGS